MTSAFPAAEAHERALRNPTTPITKPKVIVADDDAVLSHMISFALSRQGFIVSCVPDGEAAWARLSETTYDLLITDHDMPRLTGLELVQRVRTKPLAIPVVLISGSIPKDSIGSHTLLSPGVFLPKPFDMDDLLKAIRQLIPLPEMLR